MSVAELSLPRGNVSTETVSVVPSSISAEAETSQRRVNLTESASVFPSLSSSSFSENNIVRVPSQPEQSHGTMQGELVTDPNKIAMLDELFALGARYLQEARAREALAHVNSNSPQEYQDTRPSSPTGQETSVTASPDFSRTFSDSSEMTLPQFPRRVKRKSNRHYFPSDILQKRYPPTGKSEQSHGTTQGELVTDPNKIAMLNELRENLARFNAQANKEKIRTYTTRRKQSKYRNTHVIRLHDTPVYSDGITTAYEKRKLQATRRRRQYHSFPSDVSEMSSMSFPSESSYSRRYRSFSPSIELSPLSFATSHVTAEQQAALAKRMGEELPHINEQVVPKEIPGINRGMIEESIHDGHGAINTGYDAHTDRYIVSNSPKDVLGLQAVRFQMYNSIGAYKFGKSEATLPFFIMGVNQDSRIDDPIRERNTVAFFSKRAKQHNAFLIVQYYKEGGDLRDIPEIPVDLRPSFQELQQYYAA